MNVIAHTHGISVFKIHTLVDEYPERKWDSKWWTIPQILEEINRDRSEDWSAYDESDWLEGWLEWVDDPLDHFLDREAHRELLESYEEVK